MTRQQAKGGSHPSLYGWGALMDIKRLFNVPEARLIT